MSEYDIRRHADALEPLIEFGHVTELSEKYTQVERFVDRGDFAWSKLISKVTSLRPGELSLVKEEFFLLQNTDDITGATFGDIPWFKLGRQQSRTGVKFGELVFDSETEGQTMAHVAIKYTTPRLAAREFGALVALNHSVLAYGGPITFTPYGFAKHPYNGKVGLVSEFKPDVLTTDKILWNREATPTERQVVAALGHAALSIADLHSIGIAHGDIQPKNVAISNKGIWYTDLEESREFIRGKGLDSTLAGHLMRQDITTFLQTRGNSNVEMVAEFFAKPYVDVMSASHLPSFIVPTFDEIIRDARLPVIINRF